MKKIDLHIHTISTPSDKKFDFDIEAMNDYVNNNELDCIAITNHNTFNFKQFKDISARLKTLVLPGIEIDVERTHLLVISSLDDVEDFANRCDVISQMIPDEKTTITLSQLFEVFPALDKYIVIPHYQKSPEINEEILNHLKKYVTAGEVSSAKKFYTTMKDLKQITPVLFSDLRMEKNLTNKISRMTYLNIGEVTFSAIKTALIDKSKVHLTKDKSADFFEVMSGTLKLSTGLNVLLGQRSSGKTYILNKIGEQLSAEDFKVKHLKQFSLIQDEKEEDKVFSDDLKKSVSEYSRSYLKEFSDALGDVVHIDLSRREKEAEQYIFEVKKFAENANLMDVYSRANFYTESLFTINNNESQSEVVSAVKLLIENVECREIINRYIDSNKLREMICDLILKFRKDKKIEDIKKNCNSIIRDVKKKLSINSSSSIIDDIDLREIIIEKKKVEKFNALAFLIREEKELLRDDVVGFVKVVKKMPFTKVLELQNTISTRVALSECFKKYGAPFEYLKALSSIMGLNTADLHKLFVNIKHEVLNESGFPVSGGERSEFRLLQEISQSIQYDMLLIDEPESSFDNIFLMNRLNRMIKEISTKVPILLVTHNSTIGASISPDYLIYTEKNIINREVVYDVFSGYPTDKQLKSYTSKVKDNYFITLDCLEAGRETYESRRKRYEALKN